DHPADSEYNEGATSNTVTWSPSEAHPSHYIVYRNDTEIAAASWDGSPITVNVDGLSVGVYNYTIMVYDTSGNWVSDTVLVRVYETTLPIIDQPGNIDYEAGTTGNTIIWTPSDAYPSHYTVYRNDTEIVSASWDGGSITVYVDGLNVGVYNYTIMVYDTSGNWIRDIIIVTVYDISPPMIDQPLDVEYGEGTTGNTVTWTPSDAYPSHYVIYQNDTPVISDSWDGSSITKDVDGLSVGVYNYTIAVYDTSGNWVSDIVLVTVAVSDMIPPIIDHPLDVEYEEGTTGNTISWTPSDVHPSLYVVYQNGTMVALAIWNGTSVTINIEGLSMSVYNYTIVVYDTFGNWVRDTVFVTVDTLTSPTIDQPTDMDYEEGTTGNTITWIPGDVYPSHYVVYRNDIEVASASWDGNAITVEVDGLSVGLYNYTIVVYDTSGNWVRDTVILTVVDTTIPTIDHPADIYYEEGISGNTIIWTPSDAHPFHYVVYLNGTEVISDSWNGSLIIVEVDGLSVGVYNYTIVVYDTSGNSVSDANLIIVLPHTTTTTTTTTTATTTTTSEDMTGLIIVFLGVGGIGVIFVVLILMRFRRGS
ncbi:MAG: hypothetical protein ACTSV2_11470, partial [Candidatus Thorarchaeota archaeon]